MKPTVTLLTNDRVAPHEPVLGAASQLIADWAAALERVEARADVGCLSGMTTRTATDYLASAGVAVFVVAAPGHPLKLPPLEVLVNSLMAIYEELPHE